MYKKPTPQNKYKNSEEARKLCRAALKKYKTERAAAEALGMHRAEFHHQLVGARKETAAMKLQLKKAQRRWCSFGKNKTQEPIDKMSFQILYNDLKQKFELMGRLLST